MKRILMALVLTSVAALPAFAQRGKLVWSDEFNRQSVPDTSRWKYELGDGCPSLCGWGNHELQTYTDSPDNVYIRRGRLVIEAKKAEAGKPAYTSARLQSRQSWQYGYIEVRARLPQAIGTWPAIWMLPAHWKYGGWPASGEIDIMEHVGYDPGVVHGTVHTEAFNHGIGTQKGKQIKVARYDKKFHRYAIRWTADRISFFVDDQLYNTFSHTGGDYKEWPFDQPFQLLLNLAIGGDWGGREGVDDAAFPQRLEIDYVRVYELDE